VRRDVLIALRDALQKFEAFQKSAVAAVVDSCHPASEEELNRQKPSVWLSDEDLTERVGDFDGFKEILLEMMAEKLITQQLGPRKFDPDGPCVHFAITPKGAQSLGTLGSPEEWSRPMEKGKLEKLLDMSAHHMKHDFGDDLQMVNGNRQRWQIRLSRLSPEQRQLLNKAQSTPKNS